MNYQFDPLQDDQIRTIALLPGAKPEPLECRITIRNRSERPNYQALSYVWGGGDQGTPGLLYIHGKTSKKLISIQSNLEAALRSFRTTATEQELWVDSVCINQDDPVERSKQVARMADTFGAARRALVWLGEGDRKTGQAIDHIKNILTLKDFNNLVETGDNNEKWDSFRMLMNNKWFSRRWVIQEVALAREAELYWGRYSVPWPDFCDAVTLFQRYYDRMSKNFLVDKFKWNQQHLGVIEASGACQLVSVVNNLFREGSGGRKLSTLAHLVSNLTMFDALQEHGIIYAVLAIAKDTSIISFDRDADSPITPTLGKRPFEAETGAAGAEGPPRRRRRHNTGEPSTNHRAQVASANWARAMTRITEVRLSNFPVDYKKSFLAVCKDYVGHVVKQSGSLDVICQPWVPRKTNETHKLPSWVKDMSKYPFGTTPEGKAIRTHADPLVEQTDYSTNGYRASGLDKAQPIREGRPNQGWGFASTLKPSDFDDPEGEHRSLFVQGFILDEVAEVTDSSQGPIPDSWFKLAGWDDRNDLPPGLPPGDLCQTLVAGRNALGTNAEPFYRRALQAVVHEHVPPYGNLDITSLLATPRGNMVYEELLKRIQAVTLCRKLVRTTSTTKSALGLAPSECRAGDLVCILHGCSVPVILRRRETDIGTKDGKEVEYFELIGEAYVHMMMEGEALEWKARQGKTDRQFELR